jgi:hypothetical protein
LIFAIGPSLKRFVAGVLVLLLLGAPVPSIKEASAESYMTGSGVYAPPMTGPYAYYATYGAFGPDHSGFPRVGESFMDPVFGRPIKRLTNEMGQGSFSEIYSKNGYFNANGSLVHHRTPSGHNIISTSTGQVVRAGVAFNYDSSFAPDDPDAWYYFDFDGGSTLYKYSVSTGNRVAVKTFAGALGQLGGSVDWIDRTGRYMVLNIGGATRVYDKQSDTLYAGSIPGSYGGGNGWRGISPDGNYVITSTDGSPGALSHSWKIDHANKNVSTTPVLFWTACGGHADIVSASNGKTYFVSFDCNTSISIYAVDVTLPQSASNVAQQLSQNRKLVQLTSWSDSGHFSRVSKGPMQDWMYVSVESGDDGFSAPVTGWRAFKQEILQVNVLTGEVRRLAHHRSRGLSSGTYYAQPRVSATWDGSVVLWTSNFGYSSTDYADLYAINVSTGASASAPAPAPAPTTSPLAPTSSPLALTFSNPGSGATVSGTATVTVQGSGGSGTGYTYSVSVGGATVYTGTSGAFGWNTTSSTNGSVTLTARVTDSAGATAQTSRTVSVSNTTSSGGGTAVETVPPSGGGPAVAITAPTGTVWTSTMIRVAASATSNAGLARIELWGDGKIFETFPCSTTTCSGVTWWVTGTLPAGSYIVNAVAVDKAGNRTRSAAVTIVKDATSPTYSSGAPDSSTTTTTGTTSPTTSTTSPTTSTNTTTAAITSPSTSPTTSTDTTAPTAAITGPPSGVWTGASLQVSMKATDNVKVAKIDLYANGQYATTLACTSASCSGTVTWNSAPFPSGKHTLTAVATDAAGNRTTSAPVTIYK